MNASTKVVAGTVIIVVGMVVAGFAAVFMPDGRLEHFGRWLTDPATALALAGLVTAVAGAIFRARHLMPVVVLALLVSVTAVGCGGALTSDQHHALAIETQRCLIAEREIVDRPGTTLEQDTLDLRAERARCDAARAAIVGAGQ